MIEAAKTLVFFILVTFGALGFLVFGVILRTAQVWVPALIVLYVGRQMEMW